jgi:hypothetical protein
VNGSQIKFFAQIGLCPEFKTRVTSNLEDNECIFEQQKIILTKLRTQ